MNIKLYLFPYPLFLTSVLGAKKNRLIETVLLSTHSICFGSEIRKIIFQYAFLSGDMCYYSKLTPNARMSWTSSLYLW